MVNLNDIKITKRDGRLEPLNISKINRVLEWAAEGLNVSTSNVEMNAKFQFFNGISTEDIHDTLVKSAADLIDEDNPDYQLMAARLAVFKVRKDAYGDYTPPKLKDHVKRLIEEGWYNKEIKDFYTENELDYLDEHINHSRDNNIRYAGVQQMINKYLIQDRSTKRVKESPQMMFMLIGMCLYSKERFDRLEKIINFYNEISQFRISLSTPIIAGVRSNNKFFTSCIVIDTDDHLNSINASANTIINYISRRAGIGINFGRIRAIGSKIRNGEATHTGIVPFIKHIETAVTSCHQGNLRGGAATLHVPVWHYEIESIIVLKNNKGTEENRARHLDYSIQLNKHFYKKASSKEDNTYYLFSPSDVPGLYEAFFKDQEEFERLYNQYSNDSSIRKTVVNATELLSKILIERQGTGRIYIMNVDNVNNYTPFIKEKATIYSSNLCQEIALPTIPLKEPGNDVEGEIGLCILSAINMLEMLTEDNKIDYKKMQNTVYTAVNTLDNLIDFQDYVNKMAERPAKNRRSIGIGVINFAAWAARLGYKYTDKELLNKVDEFFETMSFFAIKASIELAKEKGQCELISDTQWAKGILPFDRYNKNVDKLLDRELTFNTDNEISKEFGTWNDVKEDLIKYGIRNSTLLSIMPSETSSLVSNATNGIEPPRGYTSVKVSKDGILKQVVPDINKYKDNYTLLWNLPNNESTINISAVIQKWVCQAISTNLNYDPKKYPDGKTPVIAMMKDVYKAYSLGLKTLYYHNTRDGQNEAELANLGCESGACAI